MKLGLTKLLMVTVVTVILSDMARAREEPADGFSYTYFQPIVVPTVYTNMPTRPGPKLDLHLVMTTREGREKGLCLKYPVYNDAILTEFHARPVLLSDDGAIDDPARLIKRLNVLLTKVLGSKVVFGVSLRVNFNDELADGTFQCRK
jgi:hypothetical protein